MSDFNDLGAVLERATDRIDAPGRAADALVEARRRRVRQRGAAAGLVAAAAVLAVVVGVRLASGPTSGTGLPPAESPTATPSVTATAPAIPRAAIQPVWDPRGAEGLPVVELGVPRVMEELTPGVVTRPVAVLDDGERALLVSADGLSADLDLPEGLGRSRDVSLSPDGTRLLAVGLSGIYWRTVDGEWQRVERPGVSGEAQVTWLPDSSGVIARDYDGAVRLDLSSGEVEELPYLRGVSHVGIGPDGSIISTEPGQVAEWQDGEEQSRLATGPLEGLVLPAVGESAIAFARSNLVLRDRADDRDGLVVVDRETFETRAYLPVPDHHYYVHAEELRPVTWLDEDTLAFIVLPKDAAKEYLLTWNVETGEVSRISCWLSSFEAVFATDLLG